MKVRWKNGLCASMGLLVSTNVFCGPASTEYVNVAIQNLRQEINNVLNSVILSNKNQTNSLQNQLDNLPILTHRIGEIFHGGMIFYVDETQQHGLIVSLADLGSSIEWRNSESGDRIINSLGLGIGAGEGNTRLIVAEQTIDQQEDGQFAALLASNYQVQSDGSPCAPDTMASSSLCYGGWFLPSLYELKLLYTNLKEKKLGQLEDDFYWSSSEINATQAWAVDFGQGLGIAITQEKSYLGHVRAVHTF